MSVTGDEKIFVQYLRQGVLLLAMKEFTNFHFEIDKTNNDFIELGKMLLKEPVNFNNYNRGVRRAAIKLLESRFSKEKISLLLKIFSEIESTYQKSSPEIHKTILANKMFLEDTTTKKNHFPMAIARLLEDTLLAFKE